MSWISGYTQFCQLFNTSILAYRHFQAFILFSLLEVSSVLNHAPRLSKDLKSRNLPVFLEPGLTLHQWLGLLSTINIFTHRFGDLKRCKFFDAALNRHCRKYPYPVLDYWEDRVLTTLVLSSLRRRHAWCINCSLRTHRRHYNSHWPNPIHQSHIKGRRATSYHSQLCGTSRVRFSVDGVRQGLC